MLWCDANLTVRTLKNTVQYTGVRGITDLMVMPGLINLDFADVKVVMSEMGKAMMGTGEAEGEHRAVAAAEAAISNPLLDNISMKGARGILINITGGMDMTLFEVDAAANRIREEVDEEANIIFGSTFDENSAGRIRVSVLATGIDSTHTSNSKGRMTRGSESDLGVSDVGGDSARVGVSGYARAGQESSGAPAEADLFSRGSGNRNSSLNWNSKSFDVPAFLRKK
ncbi:cell division protein FtsZ [Anaplasma phagocytophilum str. HZ2]|uniref:Tubulin/FtsZ family, C-terminal domain protein n=1 Tax=Anaplasma phagocytophilum (strain HZ) TaxID=212042 RepID=Q2GLJ5_ANAPZ|nr:tubulin/FtsZ family, C-terminal domain protein [Anaplasma phagocytophilum str. HZ]AGR78616.1 cell division protein FtsZ [Anaplasma phagocytophilum str. HZ2]